MSEKILSICEGFYAPPSKQIHYKLFDSLSEAVKHKQDHPGGETKHYELTEIDEARILFLDHEESLRKLNIRLGTLRDNQRSGEQTIETILHQIEELEEVNDLLTSEPT